MAKRGLIVVAILLGSAATVGSASPEAVPDGQAAAQSTIDTKEHCGGDTAVPVHPQLLPGYGSGGLPIRTSVPEAQAYFDNGMQLAHAFAHKAAIAAFAEAFRLDPSCAMCAWSEAWASGPTINYPLEETETAELAKKALQAKALGAGAPEKEQALIEALALRYRPGNDTAGNLAFAKAMDALAMRYPEDNEIQVLAADAWMTYDSNRNAFDNTGREVALLEPVLRRNPDYTPAIHFYIHATEIGGYPERAEAYADRLPALAPAASHLIHMPSHTYYHVGRYQDAVDANVKAVEIGKANAKRLGLPEPDGVWGLPYHAHNVQYGVGAALISGDGKNALALSDPLVTRIASGNAPKNGAFAQMIAGTAYFAEARFAEPARVLAIAAPPAKYPFAQAYWHYMRGEAQAKLGNVAGVRSEAAAMIVPKGEAMKDDAAPGAARMIAIGRLVLAGRAAMITNDPKTALGAYRKAAKLQESGAFQQFADPPAFWYPVRRDAAVALLAMGKPREALGEADATLKLMPKDPETEKIRGRVIAMLKRQTGRA